MDEQSVTYEPFLEAFCADRPDADDKLVELIEGIERLQGHEISDENILDIAEAADEFQAAMREGNVVSARHIATLPFHIIIPTYRARKGYQPTYH
ncbi:MAG: hypothetical protein ABIE94_03795 [archaeon]